MAKRGRPKKISKMQVHLPKEVQSPERSIKKAAKRGRPTKADVNLKWVCERLESIVKKQNGEIKGLKSACDKVEQYWHKAEKDAEDRLVSNQVLAKQIVAAEERIQELLAEVRQYEHEQATLRHIIIDALRGYER